MSVCFNCCFKYISYVFKLNLLQLVNILFFFEHIYLQLVNILYFFEHLSKYIIFCKWQILKSFLSIGHVPNRVFKHAGIRS